MLAKFFFLATFFAASAFSAAVPTSTDSGLTPANMTTIGDPIVACKENNIDIHGPIPDDAVKQPDGSYHFTEGSNAYHWVRAQAALAESTDYKKREFANIGIGMFAKDWCGGNGAWFDDVSYGVQSYNTLNYFSVGISYRGLRNNEHLDFSKLKGNDWCGTYVYSAGFETPIGCFNSQAINCFRLWV